MYEFDRPLPPSPSLLPGIYYFGRKCKDRLDTTAINQTVIIFLSIVVFHTVVCVHMKLIFPPVCIQHNQGVCFHIKLVIAPIYVQHNQGPRCQTSSEFTNYETEIHDSSAAT